MKAIQCYPTPQPADAEIEAARAKLGQTKTNDNDPVRIAFAWLDAQLLRQNHNRQQQATKHLIEDWAGRYVAQDDVEVAAALHPLIKGEYPGFNLSSRRVLPHDRRLSRIASAKTMGYRESAPKLNYTYTEE